MLEINQDMKRECLFSSTILEVLWAILQESGKINYGILATKRDKLRYYFHQTTAAKTDKLKWALYI